MAGRLLGVSVCTLSPWSPQHMGRQGPSCCPCLLQPPAPRVLELPPWFPRLPFSPGGELSCPYSQLLLPHWFFTHQSSSSAVFSLHRGSIPTRHDQHLHICSFICRPAHRNICFPPLLMFCIHLKPLCIHVWSLCCVWWASRPRLAHRSAWWRPFVGQPDPLLSGHGEGLGHWDLLDFSIVM